MNLKPIFVRENIIKLVREFFYSQDFHEVITPVLNTALPLEPNLHAFESTWNTVRGKQNLYLSLSPEAGLKKMIAAGIGNCFALGKSFRNLEDAGGTHIPEFLMLEWYRQKATYEKIMEDTENLILWIRRNSNKNQPEGTITYQNKTIDMHSPWARISITDLFLKHAGLHLEELLSDVKMIEAARQKGYSTENATWEQLFNQIFLNEIEPHIGMNPCFVIDFPSRISPLCTPKKKNPDFCERFELYLGGMELGNGNTENTDADTVNEVFRKENETRTKQKLLSPPIDTDFLNALETMKSSSYAGIGIGIDRLTMLLSDVSTIREIEILAVK